MSKSGPDSPRWKGGHRYWSKGRYGSDKDGLSWKVQRKLAWERDNYTCQHCGIKPPRNPDVHHKDPWMNSQSHHLDNLICLCQSCHMKEEAKVQVKWSGFLHRGVKYERPYNTCACGSRCLGDVCWDCKNGRSGRVSCPHCGSQVTRREIFQKGCRQCLYDQVMELSHSHTQAEAARVVGCAPQSLKNWFPDISFQLAPNSPNPDIKAQVFTLLKTGMSPTQVATELGVPRPSIYKWKREMPL